MFLEIYWDVQEVHLQKKKEFEENKWIGCITVHLKNKYYLKIHALLEGSVVLRLEGGSMSNELEDAELNAVLLLLLMCLQTNCCTASIQ